MLIVHRILHQDLAHWNVLRSLGVQNDTFIIIVQNYNCEVAMVGA